MPGPAQQSNFVRQSNIVASAVAGASIDGVVAGRALVSVVFAVRPSSSSADVVSGYGTTIGGSPANSWGVSPIFRSKLLDSAGVWCLDLTAWIAHNVSPGNTVGKPTFAQTDGLWVWHHMDEWPEIVASSAVDKTSTGNGGSAATSASTGTTPALVQTNEVVIAAWGGRYQYALNGGSTGAGTKPASMDAILNGAIDNLPGVVGQTSYKDPAGSTAGVSASWTYADAGSSVCGIFTLKQGTTNLRLEVDDFDYADMNGTIGWTFWAWAGDPFDQKADKRWVAYSASLVDVGGGVYKLVFPDAPPGAIAGNTYNVFGYQPGGSKTTGLMQGVVRAY